LKIIRIWCGEGGEHHKQQYCDELHHFTLQNIYKKKKEQLNDDELEWSDGGIWLFIAIERGWETESLLAPLPKFFFQPLLNFNFVLINNFWKIFFKFHNFLDSIFQNRFKHSF
jgi:hypothetical protein